MTDSRAVLPAPDDARELAGGLARDLAGVSGLLSEIEGCWRSVQGTAHGLPSDRLVRLQYLARLAGADIRSLAEAAPGHTASLALSAAGWLSLLKTDTVAAWAMTRAGGAPAAGDTALWDSVADTLSRASAQMLRLVLAVVPVTGWSVNGTPPTGAPALWLLIELS